MSFGYFQHSGIFSEIFKNHKIFGKNYMLVSLQDAFQGDRNKSLFLAFATKFTILECFWIEPYNLSESKSITDVQR